MAGARLELRSVDSAPAATAKVESKAVFSLRSLQVGNTNEEDGSLAYHEAIPDTTNFSLRGKLSEKCLNHFVYLTFQLFITMESERL